tara:strand:+ start:1316 stop:2296 length:981 start_codon:yes stop_codon:yes gene_type:complete
MSKKLSLNTFTKKKNFKKIFTPGPSSLCVENLLGIEPCFGRGDERYDQIEKFVLTKIKKISGHKYIAKFQGSGSLALEIMGLNFLYGKVLIINSGYYSDRLYSMTLHAMKKYKFIKKILYVKLNDLDNVSGNFDWVYSCYTETSIGLKLPIKKIKMLSKKRKALLMLDATASIGLEKNHHLADVIGFSSCKGLFGLTGGAFITYNKEPQNRVDSFYMSINTHLNKKMTGPYHTICSLYEILKKHNEFKYSVKINKIRFLEKFSKFITLPETMQPLICTHVNKEIKGKNKNTILYQSRGNITGSVVSHLGEVHLKKKAKAQILRNIN